MAFVGYFGGKFVQNQFSKADDNAKQNKTEVTVKQQQPVQQKVSKSQKNKESKTADFTKEMSALEKAYKNRFDTALKIILGETARDKLYQQVDSLEKPEKLNTKTGQRVSGMPMLLQCIINWLRTLKKIKLLRTFCQAGMKTRPISIRWLSSRDATAAAFRQAVRTVHLTMPIKNSSNSI